MGKEYVGVALCAGLIMNLLCTSPAHGFFFDSLFRRQSENGANNREHHTVPGESRVSGAMLQAPQRPQHHQWSGPPYATAHFRPQDNIAAGTSNFHVPKSLCIACENFPWMPVAGDVAAVKPLQPQEQQIKVHTASPPTTEAPRNKPFAMEAQGSFTIETQDMKTASEQTHENQPGYLTIGNQVDADNDNLPPLVGKPHPPPGVVWHPTSRPALYTVSQNVQFETNILPAASLQPTIQQQVVRPSEPSVQQIPLPSSVVQQNNLLQPTPTIQTVTAVQPPVIQPSFQPSQVSVQSSLPPPQPIQDVRQNQEDVPPPPIVPMPTGPPILEPTSIRTPPQPDITAPEVGPPVPPQGHAGIPPRGQELNFGPVPSSSFNQYPQRQQQPGLQIHEIIPGKLVYQDHIRVQANQKQPPPPPPFNKHFAASVTLPILSPQPVGTLSINQIPVDYPRKNYGKFLPAPTSGLSFSMGPPPPSPQYLPLKLGPEQPQFSRPPIPEAQSFDARRPQVPPPRVPFQQQQQQQYYNGPPPPQPPHQGYQPQAFNRPTNQANVVLPPQPPREQGGYQIIVPVSQFERQQARPQVDQQQQQNLLDQEKDRQQQQFQHQQQEIQKQQQEIQEQRLQQQQQEIQQQRFQQQQLNFLEQENNRQQQQFQQQQQEIRQQQQQFQENRFQEQQQEIQKQQQRFQEQQQEIQKQQQEIQDQRFQQQQQEFQNQQQQEIQKQQQAQQQEDRQQPQEQQQVNNGQPGNRNNIGGMLPPAPFQQLPQINYGPPPPHAAINAIVNGNARPQPPPGKFLPPFRGQNGNGRGAYLVPHQPQLFGMPVLHNTLFPDMKPPAPYLPPAPQIIQNANPTAGGPVPEVIFGNSAPLPGPFYQQHQQQHQQHNHANHLPFRPYIVEVEEKRNLSADNQPPFIPPGNSIIIQHSGSPQAPQHFVPIPIPSYTNPTGEPGQLNDSAKETRIQFTPNVVHGGYTVSGPSGPAPTTATEDFRPKPGASWEIIPAKQYDITNLLKNPSVAPPEGPPPVPIPVPVPMNFPVTPNKPDSPPLFVLANRPPVDLKEGESLVTKGAEITNGHDIASASSQTEEIEKNVSPVPTSETPAIPALTAPQTEVKAEVETPALRGKFPIGATGEEGKQQVVTTFDPLPPSIVTALHHAQRTSFLTHSHLLEGAQGPHSGVFMQGGFPLRNNGFTSIEKNRNTRPQQGERAPASSDVVEQNVLEGGGILAPQFATSPGGDQLVVGCGGQNQWIAAYGQRIPDYKGAPSLKSPVPIAFSPPRQSSVQWIPAQAVLTPNYSPSTNHVQFSHQIPASSFVTTQTNPPQSMFSSPVFGWSPKVVKTFNTLATPSFAPAPAKDAFIPTKISPVTKAPFDVISGAAPEVYQDSKIQSLDEGTQGETFISSPSVTKFQPSQPIIPATRIVPAIPSQTVKDKDCIYGDCEVSATATITAPVASPAFPVEVEAVTDSTVDFPVTTTAAPDAVTETTAEYQSQENVRIAVTEVPITSTPAVSVVYPSYSNEFGAREKIRIRVGSRFPAGRPAVQSPVSATTFDNGPKPLKKRPIFKTTTPSPQDVSRDALESSESLAIGSYEKGGLTPENSLITLDDIYRKSEVKPEKADENVSTEQSTSFSVSVASSIAPAILIPVPTRNTSRKLYGLQSSESIQGLGNSDESVAFATTTTPLPLATDEQGSSGAQTTSGSAETTTIPPNPSSMVTKVVKTVRVRQRMRPGFQGRRFSPLGRVRVIQRPVTPDYAKSFPEYAAPEGEALGKEEEQEVKNALIDLKKVPNNKRLSRTA